MNRVRKAEFFLAILFLLASLGFLALLALRGGWPAGKPAVSNMERSGLETGKERDWRIDDFKLADLTLGMSEEEVIRALGEPQKIENLSRYKFLSYPNLTVETRLVGGRFIVEGMSVSSTAYSTFRGIRFGDSPERVKEVYGEPEPSPYPETGYVYRSKEFSPPGKEFILLFQFYREKVSLVAVGEETDWTEEDFRLAGLDIKMQEGDIVRVLGEPPEILSGNEDEKKFLYPGLTISLRKYGKTFSIQEISVSSPKYPTARGTKVGDSKDEVLSIYQSENFGGPYGAGINFEFDNGSVSSIVIYPFEADL